MYKQLDEEHYVENPFLEHLKRIGWRIYRQNKDNPEDIKEIISFSSSFEPINNPSPSPSLSPSQSPSRESFREVILEIEFKNTIKTINYLDRKRSD